jgi:electron transport complex protein RnfD
VNARSNRFQLQAAPFLHTALSTPKLMVELTLCTVPVIAAASWFFGVTALLVVASSTLGALLAEYLLTTGRRGASLRDGSGVLTGVLVGLTLPPAIPLWMAALGGFVGIALGKQVFGGLGQNLFNPALVGRAFLQAAFPTAITTWTPPGSFFAVPASTFAWPFLHGQIDGSSAATPLNLLKSATATPPDLWNLLSGNVAGSLGETSAIVLLLCGLWLLLRRAFDWRIPAAILLAVAVLGTVLHLVDPGRNPAPWYQLCSGGLMLGAVFMATDPVSSPTTPRGAFVFGAGIGVLVVLIRDYGGLPEGVMYAILLMNAATPLIERATQPTPLGRGRQRRVA